MLHGLHDVINQSLFFACGEGVEVFLGGITWLSGVKEGYQSSPTEYRGEAIKNWLPTHCQRGEGKRNIKIFQSLGGYQINFMVTLLKFVVTNRV